VLAPELAMTCARVARRIGDPCGILRKLGKDGRKFSVATREAILAIVNYSSTAPGDFVPTSCHVVVGIDHQAIKLQSSSLAVFVFHTRLWEKHSQKASGPFIPFERLRPDAPRLWSSTQLLNLVCFARMA
jgi:hypothetical protein